MAGAGRRIATICAKVITYCGVLVAAALVAVTLAWAPPASAASTPVFVQARANEVGSGTTNALAFTTPNTAGNLIIVYAIWSNTGTATLTDSRGDAFVSAAPRTTWGTNGSSQVFVAKNIAGGANTVTATFATAINAFAVIYIHEYSGLDKANPVDVTKSATGSAEAMSSGAVTTTNADRPDLCRWRLEGHGHPGR